MGENSRYRTVWGRGQQRQAQNLGGLKYNAVIVLHFVNAKLSPHLQIFGEKSALKDYSPGQSLPFP